MKGVCDHCDRIVILNWDNVVDRPFIIGNLAYKLLEESGKFYHVSIRKEIIEIKKEIRKATMETEETQHYIRRSIIINKERNLEEFVVKKKPPKTICYLWYEQGVCKDKKRCKQKGFKHPEEFKGQRNK
jgi:hypothetical protein